MSHYFFKGMLLMKRKKLSGEARRLSNIWNSNSWKSNSICSARRALGVVAETVGHVGQEQSGWTLPLVSCRIMDRSF